MAITLQHSFHSVRVLLEQPRVARRAVAVLLVIHTVLLGYSAYVHSPTLNEPAHLVAGLSHWKFGRFSLYYVNPPLVRMFAALPVMAAGYQEDWSGYYEGPGTRPERAMGENFVAANGARSFYLFMIARLACIPFAWIGMIVCCLWARDLYGRPAGVLAGTIWCFEPNILAHASLITADAGATALGLAACYTFWRWLKQPTWMQAALTGVVLGLAELTKTTLIVFYPIWPLMWLIYRWPDRRSISVHDWLHEAGMLAVRMLIGLYVLNLGYGFEGSFTRLQEFHFVSDLFTGQKPGLGGRKADKQNPSTSTEELAPSALSANRFAATWSGQLPVPFPKNYLLGIDAQQRDFEHYGRPSYLRGTWQDHGWWYYYLYACAIKVPLGLWALGFFVFVIRQTTKDLYRTTSLRDEFILLFPALVIFVVASSKTGFSEHMRYVLPAFPFVFIAVSQAARVVGKPLEEVPSSCLTSEASMAYNHSLLRQRVANLLPEDRMSLTSAAIVAAMFSWVLASSAWIYPHSLSYFNESIGGPLNGPKHLLGSNVDWGQDLRYTRELLRTSGSKSTCYLAYYGGLSPRDVNIEFELTELDTAEIVSSSNRAFVDLPNGLYALSVNFLFAAQSSPPGSHAVSVPVNLLVSRFFRLNFSPDANAGYSIQVFHRSDMVPSLTHREREVGFRESEDDQ